MSVTTPISPHLYELATQVGIALRTRKQKLTIAESCTGGWIAKAVTDVPGSSAWFDRGFVAYSNTAKVELLDVREATLAAYGAVSAEVVTEMAAGALARSRAGLAVAVSGVAGPGGGTEDKPVGTVFLAWAHRNGAAVHTERCFFTGSREAVRLQTVTVALQGVLDVLSRLP